MPTLILSSPHLRRFLFYISVYEVSLLLWPCCHPQLVAITPGVAMVTEEKKEAETERRLNGSFNLLLATHA